MSSRDLERLLTDAELADLMQITLEQLHKLRLRHHWPCVKLGRFDVRFTPAQVEQIVAQHTEAPSASPATSAQPAALAGQTALSAARRR